MFFSGSRRLTGKLTVKTSIFMLFIFCSLFLTGCVKTFTGRSNTDFIEGTGFYFDTVISVRLYDWHSEETLEKCMDLANYYENLFGANVKGSDIWNINCGGGDFVEVHADTLDLLKTSLSFAELSEGLVDPTVGALSELWNFGSSCPEIVPDKASIEKALTHVDYHLIEIKENRVRLADPNARIELGFIAKGFIGDKMKEFLLSEGVSSALINLGGNVVALGQKPDKSPFKVGIQDPFKENGEPLLTLEISDSSVVSSGDYERFFEKNGKLYHHILSTKTGYPAESGLAQVTILSPDSARGDALSTLCFILGYEKAVSLLKNYPDMQAIFVTKDGDILYANT
ncbi:MAG: FAD:protein FMN transferase [Clostridium sp.]|nr:FAD:protein FMN transferase [Clostridium sp.]